MLSSGIGSVLIDVGLEGRRKVMSTFTSEAMRNSEHSLLRQSNIIQYPSPILGFEIDQIMTISLAAWILCKSLHWHYSLVSKLIYSINTLVVMEEVGTIARCHDNPTRITLYIRLCLA